MPEPLSEREIEILRLMADGSANGEIATRLSLSLHTIKWHSRHIYAKLAVENRTQAIQRAQTLGILAGNRQPTPSAPPNYHLPSPLTSFVGRRSEVEAAKQLLKQHRLLTLTGPGGIGKTRLALRLGEEISGLFPDGVCFVDLTPVNEAPLVINTIAHRLGVAESLDTPLLTLTQAALRDKHLLLVLDNFEHLLPAASVVADLLTATRHLTVLVTSREVLALYGEQEYVVPPLKLPDLEWFATDQPALGVLLNSEALQLFAHCAQAVYPDFRVTAENASAVASLCVRLDGLPLALELAAAYVKLLSPQTMLTQLDSMWLEMKRSLRNVPARQQTLRNTIEWSYRFLNEEEQRLFAQLAVFSGGCTLEAIGAICGQPTGSLFEPLNGLVNKSLVWRRQDRNGQPRFGMLETIREYAELCLQACGEAEILKQRHARYYTGLVSQIESLTSKQLASSIDLQPEAGNFRVALRWAINHDPEPGLRMIGDLGWSWLRIRQFTPKPLPGHLAEALMRAQRLLAAGQQVSAPVRARAYASSAILALILGQRTLARQLAEQAWLLAQQEEDRPIRAQTMLARAATLIAPNRSPLEYEEVIQLANEAQRLFAELDQRIHHAHSFNLLGEVKRMQQRYAEAQSDYEACLQELRALDQPEAAIVLANLGWTRFHLGDTAAALACFTEGMHLSHTLDFPSGTVVALIGVAGALTRLAQPQPATKLLAAADALQESIGIVLAPSDEPDYVRTRTELQTQLGQVDFDHYWQTGYTMTVAEATTLVNEFCCRDPAYPMPAAPAYRSTTHRSDGNSFPPAAP